MNTYHPSDDQMSQRDMLREFTDRMEMEDNHAYKLCIDLLCSEGVDWKRVVQLIAKRHPKAVADAIYDMDKDIEIDKLILMERKIAAIKKYREVHGVTLKEAKDAVEARMDEIAGARRQGYPMPEDRPEAMIHIDEDGSHVRTPLDGGPDET